MPPRKRKVRCGLTIEQYDELLRLQGNGCAICHRPPFKRRLAVDHNHRTGRIRGLLCYHCNYGIGVFRDSVKKLRAAADYLEKRDKLETTNG